MKPLFLITRLAGNHVINPPSKEQFPPTEEYIPTGKPCLVSEFGGYLGN